MIKYIYRTLVYAVTAAVVYWALTGGTIQKAIIIGFSTAVILTILDILIFNKYAKEVSRQTDEALQKNHK